MIKKIQAKKYVYLFLVNFIFIGTISSIIWIGNTDNLFKGLDGIGWFYLAKEQFEYFRWTNGIHSNLLAGLGNLSVPANLNFLPPYWLEFTSVDNKFNPIPIYIGFEIITFTSIFIFGKSLGFTDRNSFAASWLFLLITFPIFNNFNINHVIFLVPHFSILYLFIALFTFSISLLQRGSALNRVVAVIILIAINLYLLMAMPISYLLVVPTMFIVGAYLFAISPVREKLWQVVIYVFISLYFYINGWFHYLIGFYLDTSYFIYSAEIFQSVDSSIFLIKPHNTGGSAGLILFSLSFFGALKTIFTGSSKQRSLGVTVILIQVGIAGIWFLSAHNLISWRLPQLNFYEMLVAPFYCLFAAYILNYVIFCVEEKLRRAVGSTLSSVPLSKKILYASPVILLISWSLNFHQNNRVDDYPFPQSTVITRYLEDKIGVGVGSKFGGRVLSILPGEDIGAQRNYFYNQSKYFKNDHLTVGFWSHHLPTLHEYSPSITPEFFWVIKNFMTEGTVTHVRNWTLFTKINIAALRMMGVSYVLSPSDSLTGLIKVLSVESHADKLESLNLFKVENSNTSGISADRIIKAKSLVEIEHIINDKEFSLRTAVLDEETFSKNFKGSDFIVPTLSSAIYIEKGGFRITAESTGNSLLILPLEFSNCISVKVFSGKSPEVMRVNGAFSGLLFYKTLDIKMVQKINIFENPYCMVENYKEFLSIMR